MHDNHTQTVQHINFVKKYSTTFWQRGGQITGILFHCFSDMHCPFIRGTTQIKILNIYSSKKVIHICFKTNITWWNMFIG